MARDHGGGGRERWLITYADMLTLLLAFFIIMYSISRADAQRFKKFQQGMQEAFHLGVLEGQTAVSTGSSGSAIVGDGAANAAPAPAGPPAAVTPLSIPTVQTIVPSIVPPIALPRSTPVDHPVPSADLAVARQLKAKLAGVVPSDTRGGVDVQVRSEGVVISLYGVLMFDSGEVTVRSEGQKVLAQLADALRPLPYNVRVEGNTDSIQPDGGPYPSNWDLSTARALAVTHFLIDRAHFDPGRLSAVGFAEFRPVATNDTREGRMRNRRVDLVLVRQAPPQIATPGGNR